MTTRAERTSTRAWRPALLTDEDVAFELGCSPSYVWQLYRDGKLPARQLSEGRTRWEASVVDRFIASLPLEQRAAAPVQMGVRKSRAGRPLDSSKQTA